MSVDEARGEIRHAADVETEARAAAAAEAVERQSVGAEIDAARPTPDDVR